MPPTRARAGGDREHVRAPHDPETRRGMRERVPLHTGRVRELRTVLDGTIVTVVRASQHSGTPAYATSQRRRKLVAEPFGWLKTWGRRDTAAPRHLQSASARTPSQVRPSWGIQSFNESRSVRFTRFATTWKRKMPNSGWRQWTG